MFVLRFLLLLACGVLCSVFRFNLVEASNSGAVIQEDLDYLGQYLDVQYQVVDNLVEEDLAFLARLILTNNGSRAISKTGWNIYFGFPRLLEPDRLPDDDGVLLGESGMRAFHVNGYLFRMEATEGFLEMKPGTTREVPFKGQWWHVARTDALPNYFVVGGPTTTPVVLEATRDEQLQFVDEFHEPRQWKRYEHDTYNPPSNEERYDQFDNEATWNPNRVVPSVVRVNLESNASVRINSDWMVAYENAELEDAAHYLTEKLNLGTSNNSKIIFLSINEKINRETTTCKDAVDVYTIEVKQSDAIYIDGTNARSVFYGIHTLLALAWPDNQIALCDVMDCPRFGYRGVMLDVARNFFSVEDVQSVIDAMAQYKLNVLHLHLTDNDGWRLEVPGLEQLTQIGARRCYDPSERKCLVPVLGSDPITGGAGTGFYTVEQYRDILRYADRLHIRVIPEIDMPGHAHAAIKAMEVRHLEMNATDPDGAAKFLLSDLEDDSRYLSMAKFTDNAINPCIESTYTFIEHVIRELILIHAEVQPLEVFHQGGDEVASGAWQKSPACDKFKETGSVPQNASNADLKEYFIKRVSNISATLGLNLGTWEDGVLNDEEPYDRNEFFNGDIFSYAWDNVWEDGKAGRAYMMANAGYKTVLSHGTHLYLDHSVEADPEEAGYYWAARFVDTHKTFGYMPDSFYDNIDVDKAGHPITKEEICTKFHCPPLTEPANVLGIQGHLWTSIVRSRETLDRMLYPRLLAVAERAWHKASWEDEENSTERDKLREEDWRDFAHVIAQRELRRLEAMNITYNIRPPGIKTDGVKVLARSEFPGELIVWSEDGLRWQDYDPEFTDWPSPTAYFSVLTFRRNRTGRMARVDNLVNSGMTNPAYFILVPGCLSIYWVYVNIIL